MKKAHEAALKAGYYTTDESALVEWIGYPVRIIEGEYTNIKITTEDDLKLARILYQKQGKS